MKIYIQNPNALTSKKEIMAGIKKLGISKDLIVFSDCYNNIKKYGKCNCENWDIKSGDIFIYFGTAPTSIPDIVGKINRKKIDTIIKIINNESFGGITCDAKSESFSIQINVGICMEYEQDIFAVLKHELLHINKGNTFNSHCKSKGCFFSIDRGLEGTYFCKRYETNFKKLLNQMSSEEESK